MPPEEEKEKVKKAVLDYIADHGGEVYVDKCAEDLELTEAEVELALDSLQSEDKIEREPPEKIKIQKKERKTFKQIIMGTIIGLIVIIVVIVVLFIL